jgi:hypothetical protein
MNIDDSDTKTHKPTTPRTLLCSANMRRQVKHTNLSGTLPLGKLRVWKDNIKWISDRLYTEWVVSIG